MVVTDDFTLHVLINGVICMRAASRDSHMWSSVSWSCVEYKCDAFRHVMTRPDDHIFLCLVFDIRR